MYAYQISPTFGLDNLKKVETPAPTPGPGDVQIKMKAACLNFRDLLMIKGLYNNRQPLPLIPLSDGVGDIIALGPGVEGLRVGDRVCPIFAQQWLAGEPTQPRLRHTLGGPLPGVLREIATFPASGVVKVPSHLSDVEAATLPCAAVTAWSALVTQGQIKKGDTVLLQGTGGVSIFALQFAKAFGVHVIITSSSDEKLEKAKNLGADQTLNYKTTPKWGKKVVELTGGQGVDHVVEVGGAGTLSESLRAVKIGGQISVIGVLSGAKNPLNILPILMKQVRLQGILVGHKKSFEAMNEVIESQSIHPIVDRVFPWEAIKDACHYLESAQHFGKVCLSF